MTVGGHHCCRCMEERMKTVEGTPLGGRRTTEISNDTQLGLPMAKEDMICE